MIRVSRNILHPKGPWENPPWSDLTVPTFAGQKHPIRKKKGKIERTKKFLSPGGSVSLWYSNPTWIMVSKIVPAAPSRLKQTESSCLLYLCPALPLLRIFFFFFLLFSFFPATKITPEFFSALLKLRGTIIKRWNFVAAFRSKLSNAYRETHLDRIHTAVDWSEHSTNSLEVSNRLNKYKVSLKQNEKGKSLKLVKVFRKSNSQFHTDFFTKRINLSAYQLSAAFYIYRTWNRDSGNFLPDGFITQTCPDFSRQRMRGLEIRSQRPEWVSRSASDAFESLNVD